MSTYGAASPDSPAFHDRLVQTPVDSSAFLPGRRLSQLITTTLPSQRRSLHRTHIRNLFVTCDFSFVLGLMFLCLVGGESYGVSVVTLPVVMPMFLTSLALLHAVYIDDDPVPTTKTKAVAALLFAVCGLVGLGGTIMFAFFGRNAWSSSYVRVSQCRDVEGNYHNYCNGYLDYNSMPSQLPFTTTSLATAATLFLVASSVCQITLASFEVRTNLLVEAATLSEARTLLRKEAATGYYSSTPHVEEGGWGGGGVARG